MKNLAKPGWPKDLAALGALCLLTFVLHGSALQGYWRWDDGQHLLNLSTYSPWSVFFDPQVTRAVSGNQLAPWNLFIYQVNYALFGLNPFPYYLHHLLSLAGAAGALYLLLRHWLGRRQALLPAALLLIGAPSVHMAQQLMVGHYLDGMLFACLGLWAYVHAVQRAQWRWAFLAAALYLLSTLCKEVYVPWVALTLLLPLPAGSPSGIARWRFAAPTLAVALAYAVLRVSAFSGLGGYHGYAVQGWGSVPGFFGGLVSVLVDGLLGDGVLGTAAILMCLLCAMAAVAAQPPKGRLRMLLGLGAALVVVVFPMLFLAHPGFDWMSYTRYLWVAWIALCVLWCLKWPARLRPLRTAALLVTVAAVAQQAFVQRAHDRPQEARFEAHYAFVLNPPPDQTLLFTEFVSPIYMVSTVMSAHAAQQRLAPERLLAVPQLLRHPPVSKAERARTQVWHQECLCLVPLDSLPPARQQTELRSELADAAYAFSLGKRRARIAHGYGGSIDAVTVDGHRLHVSGWTPTLGAGRKMLITVMGAGTGVQLGSMANTERPDVVQAYQRSDMLLSGFEATLVFASPQAAQAASTELCATVLGQLPGQQHQFLLLPTVGKPQQCSGMLMPPATRRM